MPPPLTAFLRGQTPPRANPRAPLPEWPASPTMGGGPVPDAVAALASPLNRVRDLLEVVSWSEGQRAEVDVLFDVIDALGADDMVMPTVRRAIERKRVPPREVWAQLQASGWVARHPRLASALCAMVYRLGLQTVGLAAALVEAGHAPEEAFMRLRSHLWRAPHPAERREVVEEMASLAFSDACAARGLPRDLAPRRAARDDARAWATRLADAIEARSGRGLETLWMEAVTDPKQTSFWNLGRRDVGLLLVRRSQGAARDKYAYDFGFDVPLAPYTLNVSP